jgi:hypothetical protein
VDASTEDALDGAVDGSSDVSDVGAPFCSYSVSIATPFCSGCSGGCCVTNDAANTCASPICAALLTCVASADCAAGTICCLQNVTLPNSIMECPVELTVSEATSDKTTSGCTEAATCVGSMNLHMCATDADCAGAHCRKATLSNNTSFTFGVCT